MKKNKNKLHLDSLLIQNFRAFNHLKIDNLGRVNLVVGKNNVGKTSLLEAVNVYAARNHATLWKILTARDEGRYPPGVDYESVMAKINAVRFLFNGRGNLAESSQQMSIGEAGNRRNRLTIKFSYDQEVDTDEVHPTISIQGFNQTPIIDRFETSLPISRDANQITCVVVPSSGFNREDIDLLWSKIALTDEEETVLEAMRIIIPDLNTIGIITKPEMEMQRIAIARSESMEPFPMQSLGDGINRLFYISLALVNSKNGFLLIDEIGTGLHYSIQLKLWNLIFSTAEKLGVQVFATTHSNDCINAFQIAAQNSKEEGFLIRLERRTDQIVPIIFDESRLSIATREEIEVR